MVYCCCAFIDIRACRFAAGRSAGLDFCVERAEEDNLVNETSRDKKMELHTSTAVNRPGTATLQV